MKEVIMIFVGGGIGSVLRYLCSMLISSHNTTAFPWATFCVNVVGCLLIGLFGSLAAKTGMSEHVKLMLTVGVCGGFTTFSTFSNESLSLLRNGNTLLFCLYVVLSLVFGILAVLLGNYCISHTN
ncbi:MAG: fluoride efflux transporter CrcB [Bacteroidaceae bacterium]|nr:fluoride efflux transporter CrcB [Bacteroidaceae bacterium]